jgi:hypothetical protein
MGRRRQHANATERQRAYRQRRRAQTAAYTQLALLQAEAAQLHIGSCGRLDYWPAPCATAEQRALQAAAKERDMLDALWLLQTLIADFGYGEVYTHVLQHLTPEAQGRSDAGPRGSTLPYCP